MKSEVNYNVFPDDNWTHWSTHPYDEWCFIDAHYAWEHPALSDLARQTRVSYGSLDLDPPSFLTDLLHKYWIEDILKRKDDIHEDLYYAVVEYKNIHEFNFYDHPTFAQWFSRLLSDMIKNRSGTVDEQHGDKFELQKLSEDNDHWLHARFTSLVKQPYMDDLIVRIIRLMVIHDYAPERSHMRKCIGLEYANGNKNKQTKYRLYMTDAGILTDPFDPIDYEIRYNNRAYRLMIAMYPGENLLSYIHDQMAFMNFVQTTVEHDFDDEKDIVITRCLLQEEPDMQAYELGTNRLQRYWT